MFYYCHASVTTDDIHYTDQENVSLDIKIAANVAIATSERAKSRQNVTLHFA
jgi:hypothetical protein